MGKLKNISNKFATINHAINKFKKFTKIDTNVGKLFIYRDESLFFIKDVEGDLYEIQNIVGILDPLVNTNSLIIIHSKEVTFDEALLFIAKLGIDKLTEIEIAINILKGCYSKLMIPLEHKIYKSLQNEVLYFYDNRNRDSNKYECSFINKNMASTKTSTPINSKDFKQISAREAEKILTAWILEYLNKED